jgi:putative hydroxymethylpyrimidine transporter CytX
MWFGASISIAEILTGTYAASLGATQGFLAVLLGHILGCLLLFGMAFLGASTRLNAMTSAKRGFGHYGACIFAVLNVVQLFGWGSVMIYNGAISVAGDDGGWAIFEGVAASITVLIIIWLLVIKRGSYILNTTAVVLLGMLALALSIFLLSSSATAFVPDEYTFSQIVEFSAAMPISWLPVIADYTSKKGNPIRISLTASGCYMIGGMWMYLVGMFSMLKFGADDIFKIMNIIPITGVAAFIIITSTVVNTFIDGQSAGESVSSFTKDERFKKHIPLIAITTIALGFLVANLMMVNDNFTEMYQFFLGQIAAVFGPMAAVLITKCVFLKQDSSASNWSVSAFIPWLVGFVVYELMVFLEIDTFLGISLPCVAITMVLTFIIEKVLGRSTIKNKSWGVRS